MGRSFSGGLANLLYMGNITNKQQLYLMLLKMSLSMMGVISPLFVFSSLYSTKKLISLFTKFPFFFTFSVTPLNILEQQVVAMQIIKRIKKLYLKIYNIIDKDDNLLRW